MIIHSNVSLDVAVQSLTTAHISLSACRNAKSTMTVTQSAALWGIAQHQIYVNQGEKLIRTTVT